MQTQPRPPGSRAIAERRARQAAQVADDTFKGGGRAIRRGGIKPRSPWHMGPGHLWEDGGRGNGPVPG
jgi:hypothetical protein